MQAFIVRPFLVKQGIDFEKVQQELIRPALQQAEIEGDTTASVFEAGNIREDMFQRLLLADLVIADISIPNPNVYYELGIRHALRSRQTFMIRAKVTRVRLTALSISSMHMNTTIALRRTSTPTAPMANSSADSSR